MVPEKHRCMLHVWGYINIQLSDESTFKIVAFPLLVLPGFQKAHEFKKFTGKTLSHCFVKGKQQANWTNATYNEQ